MSEFSLKIEQGKLVFTDNELKQIWNSFTSGRGAEIQRALNVLLNAAQQFEPQAGIAALVVIIGAALKSRFDQDEAKIIAKAAWHKLELELGFKK